MVEHIARDWNDLSDHLFGDSWKEDLGRFRSTFVYRGLSDVAWDLRPSLSRPQRNYINVENAMLRAFKKYARQDAVLDDSLWNLLAVAQHHGLPTRLLDWTYSPLVALHFVTAREETFNVDGVVWCVDVANTNEYLPPPLRGLLRKEGSMVFTAEMLSRAASTLEEFEALSTDEFVAFFEPPSLDARMVNQYALLSLMSSATGCLDSWLAERPELFIKVIVPSALKREVRDRLDQANITERVLFPGLDGLSRWAARYYGPRWKG
ncbi:MAG TPA: FRG domain-containing protein [Symbiobacteriaceae bacterium]|nr:FRG domain-containing protein [Symbiobacteriaceae bacterium]